MNKNEHFSALDSFRGLAAVCVVLYHMRLIILLPKSSFIEQSWIFVEFFFILSGFVLTHSYASKSELTFKKFVIGRTFRLFPLHYAVFLIILAIELLKILASKYGIRFYNPPFEGRNSLSEVVPNLLLLQSWLPFSNSLSFNGPSWSLSVEYYTYIIFFCTLFVKGKLRIAIWLVISIIAFISIAKLGFNKYRDAFRGLSCFFSGALCYLIYKHLKQKAISLKPSIFSALEIISICVCIYIITIESQLKIVLASLVFISTVLIFSFEKGLISQLLKKSIFQTLGRLSYSIYMVHSVVLLCFVFTAALYKKYSVKYVAVSRIDLGSETVNILLAVFALAAIIALSSVTYKYIEKPFQMYGKKRFIDSKQQIDFSQSKNIQNQTINYQ